VIVKTTGMWHIQSANYSITSCNSTIIHFHSYFDYKIVHFLFFILLSLRGVTHILRLTLNFYKFLLAQIITIIYIILLM